MQLCKTGFGNIHSHMQTKVKHFHCDLSAFVGNSESLLSGTVTYSYRHFSVVTSSVIVCDNGVNTMLQRTYSPAIYERVH
jgi:hypothetical protein